MKNILRLITKNINNDVLKLCFKGLTTKTAGDNRLAVFILCQEIIPNIETGLLLRITVAFFAAC